MRRGVRALACALAGVLSACGGQSEPTRLVLVTDTNIVDLDSVSFSVTPPGGGDPRVATAPIAPHQPAWLVMEKSEGAALGPYKVHVGGRKSGDDDEYVYRDANVWFVEGRTMTAPLHVADACREMASMCESLAQVCAEGKCRDEDVSPDELTTWGGEPPQMAPMDAGITDASQGGDGSDAGAQDAGPPDTDLQVGDDCPPDRQFCAGPRTEFRCEDGKIAELTPCRLTAPVCASYLCYENLSGCALGPGDVGESCGSEGLLCDASGVCGGDQRCIQSPCEPRCDQRVAACELGCGSVAKCSPTCGVDLTCTVECNTAKSCITECSGNCVVNCTNSQTCNTTCLSGSTCALNCSGQGCNRVDCLGGAQCSMVCNGGSGTGSGCKYRRCEDENGSPVTPVTCPNGLVVCNAQC